MIGARRSLGAVLRGVLSRDGTRENVERHLRRYGDDARTGRRERTDDPAETAVFYDLVTDFYEYGWGESFHFAPRERRESLAASIQRLERRVADRGGFGQGDEILDAGCGIGGPMRTIARAGDCFVTGVTINAYQVERARELNARAGLADRCRVTCGDFTKLPQGDRTFDGAYTFEALCHVADRGRAFRELFRVLRRGGLLVGTDWCTTGSYDAANARHAATAKAIAEGNGLAPLIGEAEMGRAIRGVGFELIEHRDLALEGDVPWYRPLEGRGLSLHGLARSRAGRGMTHLAVRALEALSIAPRGTTAASAILNRAADALVKGGRLGIFTPLSLFVARRPGS
jgi:sterol 24-C-methyltransferase